MSTMSVEESCPCGSSLKASGFSGQVESQVQEWRSTHTKHANQIAKAISEAHIKATEQKEGRFFWHPVPYTWPNPYTITYTSSSNSTPNQE